MPTPNDYRTALEWTLECALAHVEGSPTRPIVAPAGVAELKARFEEHPPEHGRPALEVMQALVARVQDGIMQTSGGRSFAWVIGGTLPAALAADWMTSTWDQNAVVSACSPAAAVVEEVAGEWLKNLLGLPSHASFAFATGCQMAHFTCLAAARHHLLERHGWDVEADGLWNAPKLRVIDASFRHVSVDRAIRFLGIGTRAVVSTPTRLTAQDLARELDRESEVPTIVLTQAGDIHTGESEAFADLVPVAHARGAWVHVDGAFGLWARASESKRHCLEGVETADSWAVDGHKWLNVPFDSGYAFVAHPAAHRGAMGIDAPYVATSQHAREPLDWTPEWSRRARAFATYAAIFELGRDGVEEMINRTCDRATQLVEGLGRLPGMEIVRPVVLNQGLVGVCSHADTNAEDRTERLLANPKLRRETLLQASTWQGRKVIRVSVCSWRTTEEDVDRAIRAVAEALDAQ